MFKRLRTWLSSLVVKPSQPSRIVSQLEWKQMMERHHREHEEFVKEWESELGIKIASEAFTYDVPIPEGPAFRNPSGKHWDLTKEGRVALRKLITEEKKLRFEDDTRWVTGIVLPVLASLVGIIGAITGLVAVYLKTM